MNIFTIDKIYPSWTFERILRHVLYWGFWVFFYGSINGSHTEDIEMKLKWYLLEFLILFVKVPLSYFYAYYLFPKFLPQKQYLQLSVFAFIGILVAMFVIVLLNNYYVMPGQPTIYCSGKTLFRVADLLYITMPVVVIKMVQQQALQNKIHSNMLAEKSKAELQILKNQLQPHFLFNTLNNIYGMILEQEKEAGESVLKLSEIMSYMLYDCAREKVDLEKEIRMLKNYIVLEKTRYGKQLDISFESNGETKGMLIAPLLLLPFVENAFKHGVSNNPSTAWVQIHLNVTENKLFFSIENSLSPNESNTPVKSGIGLTNVKKRLDLIYAGKYNLQIIEEDFFLVKLNVNL